MSSSPRPQTQLARESSSEGGWPDNPVLTRIWRGRHVESQHRGAWVLVDTSGEVLDGAGAWGSLVFVRSSIKSLQALPLLETGAAERYGYSDDELAVALASHDGEAGHTERVARVLTRLGLQTSHLQCGPQSPGSTEARETLVRAGLEPTALHNNCSGKHAGFLALALHLGVDPERYLEPDSDSQALVRRAVGEMGDVAPDALTAAIDGCSAPAFRMPLRSLATAIARVAEPGGLPSARGGACRRMLGAAAAHPELIAGTRGRLCTDLSRASEGRLFGKIGGEAVYVVGAVDRDRGLAVKVDDGSYRGMHALVVELCRRFGWISQDEYGALEAWRGDPLRNWAGREVGHVEVVA